MSNVDLVAFQLGQAASDPISKHYQEFYLWVTRKIFNLPYSIKATGNLRTTPVSSDIIHKTPFGIYPILQEALDNLTPAVSIVLIDLSYPPSQIARGALLFHFAIALRAWCEKPVNKVRNLKTVLLLRDLPPEDDDFKKQLEPLLDSGHLIIVSESGQTLPSTHNFDSDSFLVKQMQAKGDPGELIQKKLIKRYGHFKRGSAGTEYCVPIFYDGRFCESETTRLFDEFVAKKLSSTDSVGQTIIAYHGSLSPWVENAAVAVATKRGLGSCNLAEHEKTNELLATKPKLVFLFLDMVDTGQTIREILSKILKTSPDFRINALTVMTTELDSKQDKTREIVVEGKMFVIQCVLEVEQKKMHEKCEMCALGIPVIQHVVKPGPDESLRITPYQMWSIAQKLGTEPEKDIPTYRRGLGHVPRFSLFIQQNGAWIVDKLRHLVDDYWGWVHEPLILCPDENGAEILAEQIKLILGWSVIQVPRRLIDSFSEPSGQTLFVASGESQTERTIAEIKNTGQTAIVLLDVFNVSGRTLNGLHNLAVKGAHKKPTGCLLLMDFNPNTSNPLPFEVISLYALQANIPTK